MFIVSDDLKLLLEEFDVNAEFIELDVLYQGTPYTERRFFFANLLDSIDCLDYENAEYVMETGEGFTHLVRDVGKLVIDEKKAAGYHLFRMARGVPKIIVCVSEELAQRIEASGLTGMRLIPPSQWGRF